MYVTSAGTEVFVIDSHVHVWDARPQNRRNRYGQTFIDTFYGAHVGLTPPNQRWDRDRFDYYGAEGAAKDLFEDGYCDMVVMLPVDLRDFYFEGFNTTELNATLKDLHPERVILNGRFDPRDGAKGLDRLEEDFERFRFKGVKLYTAEWNGASRGYSLKDGFVAPYLEACRRLGIRTFTSTRDRPRIPWTMTPMTSAMSTS
jgi:uncharacterized protein